MAHNNICHNCIKNMVCFIVIGLFFCTFFLLPCHRLLKLHIGQFNSVLDFHNKPGCSCGWADPTLFSSTERPINPSEHSAQTGDTATLSGSLMTRNVPLAFHVDGVGASVNGSVLWPWVRFGPFSANQSAQVKMRWVCLIAVFCWVLGRCITIRDSLQLIKLYISG